MCPPLRGCPRNLFTIIYIHTVVYVSCIGRVGLAGGMGSTGCCVAVGKHVPDLCPVGEGVSAPIAELAQGGFGAGNVCPDVGMAGGRVAASGGMAGPGVGAEWHFGDWGGGYGVFCRFELSGAAAHLADGYPVAHVGDAVGLGDAGGAYSTGTVGGYGANGERGGTGGDGTPNGWTPSIAPVAGAGVGRAFCPVSGSGGGAVTGGFSRFSHYAPVEYYDSLIGRSVGVGAGGDPPSVSSRLASAGPTAELVVGFGRNVLSQYLHGYLVATNRFEMGTGRHCPNPEQH